MKNFRVVGCKRNLEVKLWHALDSGSAEIVAAVCVIACSLLCSVNPCRRTRTLSGKVANKFSLVDEDGRIRWPQYREEGESECGADSRPTDK